MDSLLLLEARVGLEGLLVRGAPVWLPHAMGGWILQEVVAVQDILSTFATCEAFFSTVLLVLVRVCTEPEASPTCRTLVRFLPRVYSLMHSQV